MVRRREETEKYPEQLNGYLCYRREGRVVLNSNVERVIEFLPFTFHLQCYNTVNVFWELVPKLLKLIKRPKLSIFSGLENNSVTFFYLHCYNTVNEMRA